MDDVAVELKPLTTVGGPGGANDNGPRLLHQCVSSIVVRQAVCWFCVQR